MARASALPFNNFMNLKEFELFRETIKDFADKVNKIKTHEYVLNENDRFEQFIPKWITEEKLQNELNEVKSSVNKKSIIWFQMAKHLNSIYDYMQKNKLSLQEYILLKNKCVDVINYLYLILGVAHDELD